LASSGDMMPSISSEAKLEDAVPITNQ
jgi:hypothetical protein